MFCISHDFLLSRIYILRGYRQVKLKIYNS
nr:MAG TPA: hypothetical protein [Caudoviricetes sp.]DAM74348.1 MAG TPA: hypothetical protein [Caudoviricetes sp.]DAN56740.1 MAG TPA: hypothetical protein [Caudoviricetes sp.]